MSCENAKWDGTTWSALGSGVNSQVDSIVEMGGDLYFGGQFTTAGGIPANRVAKFDGTNWSALGSGTNGAVNTLLTDGANLYAGGSFTTADGVTVNNIAKWNGTSWPALGSGVNGTVISMVIKDSDLYVSGEFSTAGGSPAFRLAKWNGSTWSSVASINRSSSTMIENGGLLYMGGGGSVVKQITNTASIANAVHFSAITNDLGEPTIIYTDNLENLKVKTFTSGNWTAPQTLQSGNQPMLPILSAVEGTSQLFGFWIRSLAIEYKHFTGSSWDASPTILVNSGINPRNPTCDFHSGGGVIKCLYTSGSNAPYTINVESVNP